MLAIILGAIALNLYAVILVFARSIVYRTWLYRPMLLNIVLSIAPAVVLVLGLVLWFNLAVHVSRPLGFGVLTAFGVIWLLMLPNASYLITELNQSHRGEDDTVPLWFDIILVITLAMSGVINTVLNVFVAHLLITITWFDVDIAQALRPQVITAVAGVLLLISFGMYLGRYPRVNSWDVRHPSSFVRKLWRHFREPSNLLAAFGFTLTYALFLALIYAIVGGSMIESLYSQQELTLELKNQAAG